jgi:amino acid transporter
MLHKLKHLLVGSPLPTRELADTRLSKVRALAAFSPDALSSIAYANQEIYLGLAAAGAAGLALAWPIGLAICILLAIVAVSYGQTISGYPSGGGSYVVARDNLGAIPGLLAASALLVDYLLTAAVSLTAGVEALASALPWLWEHRVAATLYILALITLANLRGLRESGAIMAAPVYFFLFSYLAMLLAGAVRLASQGAVDIVSTAPAPRAPLTWFLVIHAFATGCTALTGIEAISNGVPSFKDPPARNARLTLGVMAVCMLALFAGSIGLTHYLGVVAGPQETILSALARRILGETPAYYLIQFTTLTILAVAANTSFAGFPRLAAILATDGYLPRQLTSLGDRLVFSNGIVMLGGATAFLIIIFAGDSHTLIPLFAVGAFLAFSLSQAGMVIHWLRIRQPGWLIKLLINGLGAAVTTTTLIIVGVSKFLEGAWITIFLLPMLVIMFLRIRDHYRQTSRQLTLKGLPPSLRPTPPLRLVIPISGVHRGVIEAVNFSRSISKQVIAVFIEIEPGSSVRVREEWEQWFPDIPLQVLSSPYRSIIRPLLGYLDQIDQ